MAKTIATRPYVLSSTRTLLLPSPLPQLTKQRFVSFSALSSKYKSPISPSSLWPSINNYTNKLILPAQDVVYKGFSKLGLFDYSGDRKFTAGATNVNDAGSIDSSFMQSMEKKIKEQLDAESVVVKDAYGDGRHVSIDVVSSAFEGKSAVNRQRMVYKAIWEELQSTVHAVDQMTTRTPNEAAAQK